MNQFEKKTERPNISIRNENIKKNKQVEGTVIVQKEFLLMEID